jgi:hypothetical protein
MALHENVAILFILAQMASDGVALVVPCDVGV